MLYDLRPITYIDLRFLTLLTYFRTVHVYIQSILQDIRAFL